MRVIVAGGRDFNDADRLTYILDGDFGLDRRDTILSGMARGADSLAVEYANEAPTKLERYPAEWDKYGKSAGYKRNEQMAKLAEMLIAFWDGKSRGTKHMIDIALREGLEVHVYRYRNDS